MLECNGNIKKVSYSPKIRNKTSKKKILKFRWLSKPLIFFCVFTNFFVLTINIKKEKKWLI